MWHERRHILRPDRARQLGTSIFEGIRPMRFSKPASTLLCGVTILGCSVGVGAQEVSRPEAGQLVEIVVTSTRIMRDGYEAPTPTTVLSAEDIEKTAQVGL